MTTEHEKKPLDKTPSIWRRILKWLSKAVFYTFLLVFVSLIAINLYLHSNRTKILDQLPFFDHGTLSCKRVSLRLFEDFPNATVSLSDVLVHDSLFKTHHIPLLKAKKITGAFSLKNIKQKNIDLQNVKLYGGEVNCFIDKNGYNNLESILGKGLVNKNKASGNGFKINTGKINIALNAVALHYFNEIKTTDIQIYADNLNATIEKDSHLISGKINLKLGVGNLTFKEENGVFLANSELEGEVDYMVDPPYLNAQSNFLKINGEDFNVRTDFDFSKETVSEIRIKNTKTDFSKTLPLLSEKIQKDLKPFSVKRPVAAEAVIAGYFRPGQPPRVDVDFEIKDNEVSAHGYAFKKVNMRGVFSNSIYSDRKKLETGKKHFRISAEKLNAVHAGFYLFSERVLITSTPKTGPHLNTRLNVKGSPSGISRWLKNDQFLFREGYFELNADIDGALNDYQQLVIETEAELKLNNFSAIYLPAESAFPFDHLYLNKKPGDADFEITSSRMKEGLDFQVEGSLKNLPALLLKLKERASSEVVVAANKLNWTDFVNLFGESGYLKNKAPKTDADKKKSMKETVRGIQYNFQPRLSVMVDTLQYFDLLELYDFKTGVHFENEHTLVLEKTSFDYEEGNVHFQCRLDISDPLRTPFEFELHTEQLNLDKLLPPLGYFDIQLLRDMSSLPENVGIDIRHKGVLDDQKGLVPNTSTGEIIFKINGGDVLLGKITYAADSTKSIFDKSAVQTKVALEGMPHLFNEFFKNDQFFFDRGRFFAQLNFQGQAANMGALLNKADGHLSIKNSEVEYGATNVVFPLTQIDLDVLNDTADFDFFFYYDSLNQQVELTGQVHNLSELVLGNTGKELKTIVNFNAPKTKWKQFLYVFAPTDTTENEMPHIDTLKETVRGVLGTFNPDLQVRVDTFVYSDKLTVEKLRTGVELKDEAKLVLNKTGFEFQSGSMALNGMVDLGKKDQAPFSAHFTTDKLDVVELVKSLDYLYLPSVENIKELAGEVTMDFFFSGIIADDAKGLVMPANNGVLDFTLNDITIKGFEPLDQIAKKIKQRERFEEVRFAPISNELKIMGENVEIPLMEIQSNAINFFVEGTLSYGTETNIWVSIPLDNLKKADRSVVPKKRGYLAARRKIYVEVTTGDNGENKFKLRVSKRKFYKQRGILPEYRKDKKMWREWRRRNRN